MCVRACVCVFVSEERLLALLQSTWLQLAHAVKTTCCLLLFSPGPWILMPVKSLHDSRASLLVAVVLLEALFVCMLMSLYAWFYCCNIVHATVTGLGYFTCGQWRLESC